MDRYAIYYESQLGRNDGNPLYIWRALKRRQEKGALFVDHLRPTGDLEHFGNYDAHIVVDWGEDGLRGILPYEPVQVPGRPFIYWASDTHLGYEYRKDYAKKSDIVFVAQKNAVEKFKADGVTAPVIWLPHAVEPEAYPRYDLIAKKYDICFVGHVNNERRIDYLDHMFSAFPNFYYGQRLFEEASRKYAESKIVFNVSMSGDVNMRCFEAMGSGSFLLTDYIPDLAELFQDGKHLVMYKSKEEAVEKAKYYLEHETERQQIAEAGYQEVLKHHTIDARLDVILETFKKHKENVCQIS